MIEKSQQVKEGLFRRWEKVSQRVEAKCHEYAKKITRISFLFRLTLFLLLLFIIASLNSYLCWPSEEKFALVKFIGSALGLVFGFLLFAQRLDVMNEQVKTANRQVETANRQIVATQTQHESEQFKQACELLGNKEIIARLGGITLLGALARTRPEEWHVTVVDILALFIRQRSMNEEESPVKGFWKLVSTMEKDEKEAEAKWKKLDGLKKNKPPADIEAATRVIACNLTDNQKTVVQEHLKSGRHWPDLSRSWLCYAKLSGAYLPNAILSSSFLYYTSLSSSDLTYATLGFAHLDNAFLNEAKLQDTFFHFTHVAGTHFYDAKWSEGVPSTKNFIYIDGKVPPQLYMEKKTNGERQPHRYDSVKIPDPISITDFWKAVHDFYG